MANTKVTSHVIANNAISASMIQSAAVTDAKLHSTLDLSGKTLTLPATAIPSASTATTQAASDNSTKIATTAYVTTAIGNLVDSAPTALDTLNELAAALGDDASFSSTVTTSLAGKLSLSGGTMTGAIAAADFEVDASGDITLDAGGANINFNDDGTAIGHIEMAGQNLEIKSKVADKDLILKGNDGGSPVTALTLDMSEAGFATFNDGGAFGGTGALRIPQGTTGQRPSSATGQIRWNTTDGALEVYNGTAWTAVGTGSSNKVLDTFTGNGSNRTFTLSVTPANEDAIMVFIDGAYQEKSDYVLTNNSLVLDTAPLNNEKIAVHIITASVHDGTTAVNQQFTATANQTDFTLSQDPKSENNTHIYINGVYQQKTDYTVTGTTLAFDTAPANGDIIEVNMFTVATLGNTDTVTEGVSNLYHTDARARGAISVSGNAISYNSSTGVLTANFEEGPTFTNNVRVSGTLGIGANASNVIGVYSTKSFANGLAAELTNSESSTGSGLVVRGGNNASTYSADFRDYNSNSLMRVRGDGNVGIGETSPSAKLHIKKTAASTQHYDSYATAIIEDTESRLQLVSTNGGSNAASLILSNEEKHWGIVHHGPGVSNTFGIGYYASSSSGIDISDSLSSPFTITTDGKVGIGNAGPTGSLHVNTKDNSGADVHVVVQNTTANRLAGYKIQDESGNTGVNLLYDNGSNAATLESPIGSLTLDVAGDLHLDGGGGSIFLKDDGSKFGTLKGLPSAPTRLVVDAESVAGYLGVAGTEYYAWNATDIRPTADNAYNLGVNGARFKDVYISGGIDFGQANRINSAVRSNNYLDDYEEGTWTPVISHNDGTGVIPYTLQMASYVKIGSVVYVRSYMTAINPNGNAGTSSPYYGIRGFPFQPVGYGSWMLVYTSSNCDSYGGYTAAASFYFLEPTGSAPHGQGHVSGTELNGWGSGLTWMFSAVYNTT